MEEIPLWVAVDQALPWLAGEVADAQRVDSIDEAVAVLDGGAGASIRSPSQLVVGAAALESASSLATIETLAERLPVLIVDSGNQVLAALGNSSVKAGATREEVQAAMQVARLRFAAETRRRLLAQVEAVGQLAGGTAHDVNNLLTVILGNLELIEMSAADPKIIERAQAAISAAESGTLMTRRLGNFSNRNTDQQLHDLNAIAARAAEEVRRHVDGSVEVRLSVQSGEIPLPVDAMRLEKVLINLADNAHQALPSGGRITIETGTGVLDLQNSDLQLLAEPVPERYAVVSVSDEGEGMDAERLAQAATLFFSTRDNSRGAGVGLSIALAYMQLEGGTIAIQSAPGSGTRVHCLLPLPAAERIVATGVTPERARSNLKVLLLDDDPMVGESTAQMLEQLGHTVVQSQSGIDVLHALGLEGDVDLVLTDEHMPGDIDGIELAGVIRDAYPALPVLLFSGIEGLDEEQIGSRILRKPFSLRQLDEAVQAAVSEV